MISIVKETITPEVAKQYLETNKINRRLSEKSVENLAFEITEGRWQLTHQGIAFDKGGVLVDGQHRLAPVVKANIPVDMMVARGLEPSENNLYAIDNGRKRTVVDMMKLGGYKDMFVNTKVIGAIQAFFIVKGGRRSQERLTHDECAKFISANESGMRTLARFIDIARNGKKNKGASAKLYAGLYSAYLGGESEEDIKSFLRCYARNEIDSRFYSKAALDLGDYLARYKLSEADTVARVENAIYCYIHNVKRSNMTLERYKAKDTWFFPVRAKRNSKEDAEC